MNKYESFALQNAGYAIYKNENCSYESRTDASGDSWNHIPENDLSIVTKQDVNYNIVKYYLRFQTTVSKVIAGEKEYLPVQIGSSSYPSVVVPLDFNNRISDIVVHFHDVIDPMKISIKFIEVDRSIYDEQVRMENETVLIEKACIKVSTGDDLVNIYFQPCSDSYDKTVIELYLAIGTYSKMAPGAYPKNYVFHPQLLNATPGQMIGKFKVEEGMMFKSITGLAIGTYGFKLSQYDDNGNLLFKTDYQYFQIG